jgi:hypothetical protein
MSGRILKIIIVTFLFIPHTVYAEKSVSIDSDTYFAISEDDKWYGSKDISTLYEYLSFDIKDDNVSFVFTGWGKVEAADNKIGYEGDGDTGGDFSEAYLNYKSEFSNFNVRLGKQVILSNLSYEGISGLSVRSDLPYNFKLEAYTGIPEELDEKSSDGDLVSGGRISSGITNLLELGVGYLTETDNKNQFRREVTADLWIMPFEMLELYGQVVHNGITESYSYSSAAANIYLTQTLTFNIKYDNTNFEDYFDTSELTIYNLSNYSDKLKTTEANLTLDLNEKSSVDLDFKEYNFKDTKDAASYGLGYKMAVGTITSKLSYHKTDSSDENEGIYDKEKLSFSLDALVDYFEKEIYQKNTSATIITSVGYKMSDTLGLSVDLDYSRNPEYNENYKLFVRAEYSFGSNQ